MALVTVFHPVGMAAGQPAGVVARASDWLRARFLRLDRRLGRLHQQDHGVGVPAVASIPWSTGMAQAGAPAASSSPKGGHDATETGHPPAFDLLIRLGDTAPSVVDAAARHARFGAIGLDFSLAASPDRGALGLRECRDGADQCGIVLYARIEGHEEPWVIRRGWYQTHWNWSHTQAKLRAAGLRMIKDAVERCCRWVQRLPAGESSSLRGAALASVVWPAVPDPHADDHRVRQLLPRLDASRNATPSWSMLLGYGGRCVERMAQKALNAWRGRPYLWQLGCLRRAADPLALDFSQVQVLGNPGKRFQADPFLVAPDQPDGKPVVFCEEWEPSRRKGHIAALELDVPASWSDPGCQCREPVQMKHLGTVIQTEHHLSFPFHFKWQGEHYLCPESMTTGCITAWRARQYPLSWEPAVVLMKNVAAVDTMIFESGGRWWMLTNLDRTGSTMVPPSRDFHSELHLFYADSPLSTQWTPHPMNPLRIDSHGGRNAGIEASGHGLFRYGQIQGFDCYGRGIAVYRIEELSTTRYREVLVRVVEPEQLTEIQGLHGLHTLHQAGELAVVDLLYRGALRQAGADRRSGGSNATAG